MALGHCHCPGCLHGGDDCNGGPQAPGQTLPFFSHTWTIDKRQRLMTQHESGKAMTPFHTRATQHGLLSGKHTFWAQRLRRYIIPSDQPLPESPAPEARGIIAYLRLRLNLYPLLEANPVCVHLSKYLNVERERELLSERETSVLHMVFFAWPVCNTG